MSLTLWHIGMEISHLIPAIASLTPATLDVGNIELGAYVRATTLEASIATIIRVGP